MKRVTLGNCRLRVTELVFGTLSMGRLQAKMPVEEGAKVILRGLELGIDCIDTAQTYGTYEHVAKALADFGPDAKDVAIISKSPAVTAADMQSAVDEARRVMKREVIDGFHLHGVRSAEDFQARKGAFETLLKLKDEGVIRAICLSTHTIAGLTPALENKEVDIVLSGVNSKGMGIADGNLERMLATLRKLKAAGKGVYAMKPLAGGHLHATVEESFKFVRGLREVDAVAVGMKTVPELEMDVTIFDDKPVPKELVERVHARAKTLLIYPTCAGCGTCAKKCLQDALTVVDGKAVVDMEKCVLCGYCAEECPTISIRVM